MRAGSEKLCPRGGFRSDAPVGDRHHTHRPHSDRLRHNHLGPAATPVAVSNLGVVLGEQTERYVQLVDRTLEDVQSRVAELGIASPMN